MEKEKFEEVKAELWEKAWQEYQYSCYEYGVECECSKDSFEPSDNVVFESMGIVCNFPTSGEGWCFIHA